jgi:hypothetical protein
MNKTQAVNQVNVVNTPLNQTSKDQKSVTNTNLNLKIPPPKINCPCKINDLLKNNKNLKQCWSCNTYQHEQCMKEAAKMTNYQCPRCQINDMDPYVKTLSNIMPALIVNYQPTDLKMIFQFKILPDVLKILEDYSRGPARKNPLYIFIRCLRLDEEGYEHHWPLNFFTSINGFCLKNLVLPKFPPRSKSRIDFPIAIFIRQEDMNPTPNFHNLNKEHLFPIGKTICLNSNMENVLEFKSDFSKNDNDKFSYVVSVDLVEILKEPEDVIKNIPIISEKQELSRFFNKGGESADEILSSEKVNLIDCYTRSQRIKIPARSINCLHLSVFDLKYYLAINRKNKSYNCPLCKKKATRIYIDGFIKNIMDENKEIEDLLISQNYEVDLGKKEGKEENNINKNIQTPTNLTSNNFNSVSQELNSAFVASQNTEKIINSPRNKNDDVEMIDIMDESEKKQAPDNSSLKTKSISNNNISITNLSSPVHKEKPSQLNETNNLNLGSGGTGNQNLIQPGTVGKINSPVRGEIVLSYTNTKPTVQINNNLPSNNKVSQVNQVNQASQINQVSGQLVQENKNLNNNKSTITPIVENKTQVINQQVNHQISSSNKKSMSSNSTPTFQVTSNSNNNSSSTNKQKVNLPVEIPTFLSNDSNTQNKNVITRNIANSLIEEKEKKSVGGVSNFNQPSVHKNTSQLNRETQVSQMQQMQKSQSASSSNNQIPSNNLNSSSSNLIELESKNKIMTNMPNNQVVSASDENQALVTKLLNLIGPNHLLEKIAKMPGKSVTTNKNSNKNIQKTPHSDPANFSNFYKKISGNFSYPSTLEDIKKRGQSELNIPDI